MTIISNFVCTVSSPLYLPSYSSFIFIPSFKPDPVLFLQSGVPPRYRVRTRDSPPHQLQCRESYVPTSPKKRTRRSSRIGRVTNHETFCDVCNVQKVHAFESSCIRRFVIGNLGELETDSWKNEGNFAFKYQHESVEEISFAMECLGGCSNPLFECSSIKYNHPTQYGNESFTQSSIAPGKRSYFGRNNSNRLKPSRTLLHAKSRDICDDDNEEIDDFSAEGAGRKTSNSGKGNGKEDSIGKNVNSQSIDESEDESTQNNKQNDGNRGNKAKNQKSSLLEMINPYNAGKSFRSQVESAINLASAIAGTADTGTLSSRVPPDRRSIYYDYYLDDRLGLSNLNKYDSAMDPGSTYAASLSFKDDRPEVLVVGATGSLGRILVRRLVLEAKVRVRVLVRDLYSSTLEKLPTGVTYCQGDLRNMDSLEYAVTDVDKIVFCAGVGSWVEAAEEAGDDLERLQALLEERSRRAESVDNLGLRNLIHAYLNVRHADYGANSLAGAAKRVLFKFQKRPEDFGLFGIDDGTLDHDGGDNNKFDARSDSLHKNEVSNDKFKQPTKSRPSTIAATLSQCKWQQNKFGHGVFVGKVGRNGEAAIASARLRSRNDPMEGLDLRSGGFAGLICRICSNGGVYEAFVRTEAYERLGIEYVCEFRTASKSPSLIDRVSSDGEENRSKGKFVTVRLDFSDFRPRMRQFPMKAEGVENDDARRMRQALSKSDIPSFIGRDIRQIGFRYRGENNAFSRNDASRSGWSNFYLALDYIKLYRAQPEPEFIYLSDARIPPVIQDGMVKHDSRKIASSSSGLDSTSNVIIDEQNAKDMRSNYAFRTSEETYFKYQGEEIIKQSGLRYVILF
ncbi:hypothetical protein ACHAXS_012509 [Conticribra weissflogii]